ncbi:MmgE/PrpD family protein [Motiliproteus sp. MSK22-1]|uniref:MmgE/PrpD family protein n=1 Tax=Motiliproteus sp. MSK22-1 TaxID=1897630 RepID=UPI00097878A3|nr:MmgE/PrpD family protein [Motiliproteus sp. MSK22-1]OMH36274.1 2-methylcitrate dehydratase [Motiliproteus sp. MSK22-1]
MSKYLDFIRNLEYEQIPEKTRELVSTSLLDIVGVAAGAYRADTASRVRSYAVKHCPAGELTSRMLFDSRPVHPLGAGWVGGFTVDSLDAHEGHFTSKGHAGATVVPALLSLADACRNQGRDISGQEFLTCLALGYELGLRAGVSLMATAPEYHASGAFSGLGVVAMGIRLMQLDDETARHALGIAEYFGPRCPMMRLVDYPSMLRDAHGAGAYAGLNGLFMAMEGITGAPAVTVEQDAVSEHWIDLGKRWEIDAQYFKPWPVCRWAQPALTAMTNLLEQQPLDAGSIESIEVDTFHESMRLQGHEPSDPDEAQYALAFPLAALVVRGQVGAQEVTGDAIYDESILAISRRITLIDAPDLSARFPEEILSRLRIRLKDGRLLETPITAAKGDPEKPISTTEFREKYRRLAGAGLSVQQIDAIENAVTNLHQAQDCVALLDLVLSTEN